ncbi:MAG TPA: NAD(P)-binding domain-containing protein [Ktedonobacteraceae bacterium]|jgi:putative flavoprotein involved in K+ transport|nr:NAD(P)-binding domain-containing protein [Ktedonobacteraceae bacterium]
MTEYIETVIIGGGQAGLALSYYLTQQGRTHLILEQGRAAETWRSGRWDSFTLNTPNWMIQLPGFPYQGDDPDGFLTRADVVACLEQYASSFHAPLQCGVRVTAVRQQPAGDGYLVEMEERTIKARNVVLATGAYPKPKLPIASAALCGDICQIHTSAYRNPQQLPSGAVLVVGTGQSGCQIAEDLHESGRQVYLSTSSCGRVPRRYRGKDITRWLSGMGFFDQTPDKLPSRAAQFACNPYMSGNHGDSINLRIFASQGMILLGRVQVAQGKQIILAPDLEENLARADAFGRQITQRIDEYIKQTGMEAEANSPGEEAPSNAAQSTKPLLTLDLQAAGISTIIWASGYQLDFDWVQLPVFDTLGYPVHQRGISAFPGLYFLGLPWLSKRKSSLLYGVGEDAAFLASAIVERG